MRDVLGHELAVGDKVVWRGHLKNDQGLVPAKVLAFTNKRVIIELPNSSWRVDVEGPWRKATVDPINLVRLRDAL